jgi:hypothetical protein
MLVTVREPCVKVDNCDTILRDEEELGRGWCFGVRGASGCMRTFAPLGSFTPGKGMSRSTNVAS